MRKPGDIMLGFLLLIVIMMLVAACDTIQE